MADGRDIIEEVYGIVKEVSGEFGDLKGPFSDEEFSEFEGYIASAMKWVKLCRRKIWLRGKQGTDMARECLDAANQLKVALDDPPAAKEAAADLAQRLEALARLVATKAQVLT